MVFVKNRIRILFDVKLNVNWNVKGKTALSVR